MCICQSDDPTSNSSLADRPRASLVSDPRSQNTASRYAVNAVSSVLTALISMTALVWVNQYLLRRISPEEYSLVPVLTALMVFAEFFRVIFTRGLSRFMVEADARGDDEEVSQIVSSMLPVLTLVSLSLALLGWLAVRHIDVLIEVDSAYRGTAQVMLGLLFVTLCISIVMTPLTAGLYVRMRFVELNLVSLGAEVLRIVVMLALLFGLGPRALWVIVASTAANLTSLAVLAAYTFHILPSARFRRSLISRKTVVRLLSFSLWTSVQGFNMLVQRAAAALLLNRFSTSIDVAAFYIGNLPNQQNSQARSSRRGPGDAGAHRTICHRGRTSAAGLLLPRRALSSLGHAVSGSTASCLCRATDPPLRRRDLP